MMSRRRLLLSAIGVSAGATALRSFSLPTKSVIALITDQKHFTVGEENTLLTYAGGTRFLEEFGLRIQKYNAPVGNTVALQQLVSTLVADPPAIAVVIGDDEVTALAQALPQVPMIFFCNVDPVGQGFALSYERPGKNATGVTADSVHNVKPLEFLSEATSGDVVSVAICANSAWFSTDRMKNWSAAAASLDLTLHTIAADSFVQMARLPAWPYVGDFDAVIAPVSQARVTNLDDMVSHFSRSGVLSMFEVFDAMSSGATLGYEELPNNWLAPIGSALRMVVEGRLPADIPIRGPDGWAFGINRAEMTRFAYVLSEKARSMVTRVV